MPGIQNSAPNTLIKAPHGQRDGPVGQSKAKRVPMLLCNAYYYGTIAAVRSLGRAGVPVTTVDPAAFAPGRFSRYSSEHLRSPPFDDPNWSDWLLDQGRGAPRRAIYATSDEVSFSLADRKDELSASFDLYQPNLGTMMRILDKGLLTEDAHAVGIDTPDVWYPRSGDDAARIVREIGGSFIAKPRSQLAIRTGSKGAFIEADSADALAIYDNLLLQGAHKSNFAKRFPEATMPMLQRYHPEAMERIYSLSGFRDISGERIVMCAAQKVLQQPRRFGIGLCFEEADVIPDLAKRVVRLCERIGYYGAFELEFIFSEGRALLIDFNGRFYNQLAFDIARGIDLPRLVYAGATGNDDELAKLVAAIPPRDKGEGMAFCNTFGMSLNLAAQRVFGSMTAEEAKRWREWRDARSGSIVDPVRDADDPRPANVDMAQQLYRVARYPRGFLRAVRSVNAKRLAAAAAPWSIIAEVLIC